MRRLSLAVHVDACPSLVHARGGSSSLVCFCVCLAAACDDDERQRVLLLDQLAAPPAQGLVRSTCPIPAVSVETSVLRSVTASACVTSPRACCAAMFTQALANARPQRVHRTAQVRSNSHLPCRGLNVNALVCSLSIRAATKASTWWSPAGSSAMSWFARAFPASMLAEFLSPSCDLEGPSCAVVLLLCSCVLAAVDAVCCRHACLLRGCLLPILTRSLIRARVRIWSLRSSSPTSGRPTASISTTSRCVSCSPVHGRLPPR